MSCFHVRLPHVVPGWGCCQCRAYNGYQRLLCKNCGHMHCYDSGGLLGRMEGKRLMLHSPQRKAS